MRIVVLVIALAFIAALGALTVLDFVHYGVTVLGVLAVFVLLLVAIGIVGALREPPQQ